MNEVDRLTRIVLKHPRDAFLSQDTIAAQWQRLNFAGPPDLSRAIDEYDRFADLVRSTDAEILALPRDDSTTLDSIYVRDTSIVCESGVILCNMGKPERTAEPAALRPILARAAVNVVGVIQPPGCVEGGDVVWLDSSTIVVGHGYRTNDEGLQQLRALLGEAVRHFIVVPLPHWEGPGTVLHLMSFFSPIDHDLAVVYSRMMPVPFREWLLGRDISFIEVPEEEFTSMGANVLALARRKAVLLAGHPRTRRALEAAGVEVHEYEGTHISLKGAGGPTCLTRPLARGG